ncbi:hypothetical protein BC829DRAFT_400995 [Chytridium lagenaria]|nr:hypothetical protein BC829DRAFT_400995 [Chytridium lagenaria]
MVQSLSGSRATPGQNQAYDAVGLINRTSHSHGTSTMSVVSPPKTAWTVPPKPVYAKRLTEAQEEEHRQLVRREEKLFEGFCVSRGDSMGLAKAIESGSIASGLDIIRASLKLMKPKESPSHILKQMQPAPLERARYDPSLEDRIERDTALADLLYSFVSEAHRIGLCELYLSFWLTVVKTTHDTFLAHVRRANPSSASAYECKDVFEKVYSQTSRVLTDKLNEFPSSRFEKQKEYAIKSMTDFFATTYIRHIKLITHMFLKPRNLQVVKIHKDIHTHFPVNPLSTGISADKWDEYVAAENEKARRQKEAELEAIEAKKREEEERFRKEQEAAAAAADPYKRVDGLITLRVPPIEPYSGPAPIFPTVERLFPATADISELESMIPAFEIPSIQEIQEPNYPRQLNNSISSETKPRPLTPHTIGTVLSQTTTPFLGSIQTYIESSIDYQMNEALARINKLGSERITARMKEKEEEELAAQRAAAEKARQNMSAKDKKDKKGAEEKGGAKGGESGKKSAGTKKATPPLSAKKSAGKR